MNNLHSLSSKHTHTQQPQHQHSSSNGSSNTAAATAGRNSSNRNNSKNHNTNNSKLNNNCHHSKARFLKINSPLPAVFHPDLPCPPISAPLTKERIISAWFFFAESAAVCEDQHQV